MNARAEEKTITVPVSRLDALLGHGDGNAALLYLHILRSGELSLTRAARELKCTEAELQAAAETLRKLGLLAESDAARALERTEAPEYTAQEVAARTGADPAFEAVVAEAEFALGKVLSGNDLKLLLGIYDYWGLQADVIMELLHHCVEKYQARSGPGRLPTMRYIEREAQVWARQEVNTLDAADAYIRAERERETEAKQVLELLQIHGRTPTAGERAYIDAWLGLGYRTDALAIAYERTVMSTGRMVWKYMDKIVRSWHEKQLFTPEEILAGDARAPRQDKARPAAGPGIESRSDDDKLAVMRRMYAHIRGGEHGA